MLKLKTIGAVASTLTAVFFLVAHAPRAEAGIVPAGATVAGKTIGEWTADWWVWAVNQHGASSATTDTTGAYANINQSGPVFFVAGQPGNNEGKLPENIKATRAFAVPHDKYLLVPVINAAYWENWDGSNYAQLLEDAVNGIDSLFAVIDGVAVPNLTSYLEASPPFSFNIAYADNPFGAPTGDSGAALAKGYYLMLEPLGTSTVSLYFGGGVSAAKFVTAVDATITGVPEPGTLALLLASLIPGTVLLRRAG